VEKPARSGRIGRATALPRGADGAVDHHRRTRVLFGLLLIVSFSTGLAAVPVGFRLLLVYARGLFARVNLSDGLASRVLPVASAMVVVVAGGVITAQALPHVL
jgi:hypothetical protein